MLKPIRANFFFTCNGKVLHRLHTKYSCLADGIKLCNTDENLVFVLLSWRVGDLGELASQRKRKVDAFKYILVIHLDGRLLGL